MSVLERWTLYIGENKTPGIWVERGDHPGWKGKLRGEFRRVVVVPEDQLAGAVKDIERLREALAHVINRVSTEGRDDQHGHIFAVGKAALDRTGGRVGDA
jgi:hypothetical protein